MIGHSRVSAGTVVVLVSDPALNFNGDPITSLEVDVQAVTGDVAGGHGDGSAWVVPETWLSMTHVAGGISRYTWASTGTRAPGFYLVRMRSSPLIPNADVLQVGAFEIIEDSVIAQVTFQVEDSGGDGLSDTRFSVVSTTGGTIFTGVTETDGTFDQLALPIGGYDVFLSRSLTAFTVPEPIVVTAVGPNTFTFMGTLAGAIVPPADPLLCRIYYDARSLSGVAVVGQRVIFLSRYAPIRSGSIGVMGNQVVATTNAQGHFEVDIVRGAQVQVSFIGTNIVRDVTIPDQEIANLLDIAESVPDRFDIVPA